MNRLIKIQWRSKAAKYLKLIRESEELAREQVLNDFKPEPFD